jgi:DNA-binding response OmpR family regulator
MRNMSHNDGNQSQTQDKTKILLIQQHLPTAMSLVSLMRQQGWNVKVATDGKEAIEIANDNEFDLIALDPDLPEGGFEIFLRLRQVPGLSKTPIVFIARRHDDASWRRGLELGAVDYIEKPLDGTAFMRRMLSHVKPKPPFGTSP